MGGKGGEGEGRGKREVCANNIPLSFDCREKRSGETSFAFQKVVHFDITNGESATISGSVEHVQLVSLCLSVPLCPPRRALQGEEAIDVKEGGGGHGGN